MTEWFRLSAIPSDSFSPFDCDENKEKVLDFFSYSSIGTFYFNPKLPLLFGRWFYGIPSWLRAETLVSNLMTVNDIKRRQQYQTQIKRGEILQQDWGVSKQPAD